MIGSKKRLIEDVDYVEVEGSQRVIDNDEVLEVEVEEIEQRHANPVIIVNEIGRGFGYGSLINFSF